MLTHPMLDQLAQLGLTGMAQAFAELEASGEGATLTHADWLGLLVDREMTHRHDKRLAARLRHARLRHHAVVEDIDYRTPRGLDRALFHKLADGEWIARTPKVSTRAAANSIASFELLPEPERVVLRRLADLRRWVHRGGGERSHCERRNRRVGSRREPRQLVTKSLVSVDVGGVMVRYQLPETIRAYALQKLSESGEREQMARRHAEYHLGLFERAEAETETRPMDEWLAEYRPRIDNLRAALGWAFSPGGNAAIGVALTAASVPLWVDLSMMAECRRHVERTIARLASVVDLDPRREMHLQAALGMTLNYTTGPVPETEAAWTKTLELARSLGDTEFQLRAFRGLWAHWMNAGEYRASLAMADEFSALAAITGDPAALGAADRMAGIILHYLGDQTGARQHLERRLARAVSTVRQSPAVRFLIDQRVAARALLARILWLQGFPDQAACTARLALDEAEASGHALSLCHALAQAACPVATLNGDVAAAQSFTAVLLDRARELGLAGWIARGHCFQGTLLIMRRDFVAGLPLLRDALEEMREGGAAVAAEDCFRQALDWAHRDGTLSYELRAAFSLGRLRRDQGRGSEAHDLVASIYRCFTEGFDTADLQTAKRLLDELNDAAAA